MRSILLALPLLLAATPAAAQQTDEQLWFQANGSTAIGTREKLTAEAIARFSDRVQGLSHTELGVLFTHTTGSGIELSFGYRHVEDWNRNGRLPNEERLRQMIMVPLGSGFSGRLRFEQRFNSSGGEIGFRLRPRLAWDTALGAGPLHLFATSEHFVNLNSTAWGARGGYERMRNAVGIAIPLGGTLKGEIGYLNQYRFGRDGARDQMDHVATFTLSLNIARHGEGE